MRVSELGVANHVDESIESQVSALCMGVMIDYWFILINGGKWG